MASKLPSVESIFGEAVEIEAIAERSAFLERACNGDKALRRQVETLLDAHDRAGDFLGSPAQPPTAIYGDPRQSEAPGAMIGPYKLLEEIGEGGMGVVYMAEQTQPMRRRVALKVVKPGMDSRRVIARFEAERQALALMDHPNIARVYDAGTTETGRPYFVMELVRGLPITEYCDHESLSIADRLELFVLVCRAVQHAHQKGVIHRDIKPTNVMVTVVDGLTVPKVIDFGIAKAIGASLTEGTMFTGFHQLVGTPLYMSPEQADLSSADVDTRSDVYSLGVLLYELLTGCAPFDAEALRKAAFDEMRRIIREQEPPRPSTRLSSLGETLSTVSARRGVDPRRIERVVRGELDWIVMKSMEKDRRRRYQSPSDFAADVLRHLNDEPVEACPPSRWYRSSKFARRHRATMTTAALLLAVGGIGLATSLRFAAAAIKSERNAISALEEAKTNAASAERRRIEVVAQQHTTKALLSRSLIRSGARQLEEGSPFGLNDLITAYDEAEHEPKLRDAAGRLWAVGIGGIEGRLVVVLPGRTVGAFTPQGDILATSDVRWLTLWDTSTWQPRSPALDYGEGRQLADLRIDPRGSRIASLTRRGEVRLWEVATGRPCGPPLRDESETAEPLNGRIDFSPDGSLIAASSPDGSVGVWDAATCEPRGPNFKSEVPIFRVVFSPNGAVLATSTLYNPTTREGIIRFWDTKTWEPVGPVLHQEDVQTMAWSPDGSLLAAPTGRETTRLWAFPSGQPSCEPLRTRGWVTKLAFSPDGRKLATGSRGWRVNLWEVASGKAFGEPIAQENSISSVQFSPDGRLLLTMISAHPSGFIRFWNVESLKQYGVTLPGAISAWFSPDGRTLVAAGPDCTRLWRVTPQFWTTTFEQGEPVWDVDISPDGKQVAAVSKSAVNFWDVASGRRQIYPIAGVQPSDFPSFNCPTAIAYSPDGRRLAVNDSPTTVRLLDPIDHRPLGQPIAHVGSVLRLAFDRGGRNLITSSRPPKSFEHADVLSLWDCVTGLQVASHTDGSINRSLAVSPDGLQLAVGSLKSAKLLGLTNGITLEGELPQGDRCLATSYSPDGAWLAMGGMNGEVHVWSRATGDRRCRLRLAGPATRVKLGPDGDWLITSEWNITTDSPGPLRFWELVGDASYPSVILPDSTGAMCFSVTPDWRWLAIGQLDGMVRVLKIPSPPRTSHEMRLRTSIAVGLKPAKVEFQPISPEEWNAMRRELRETR